jgi:hypothetical protein
MSAQDQHSHPLVDSGVKVFPADDRDRRSYIVVRLLQHDPDFYTIAKKIAERTARYLGNFTVV